jgi:ABC-type polysaccharide/polyol phosphate export permease
MSWLKLFMNGTLDFKDIALTFIYSLIIAAIGYIVFRKLRWRFAEVL